MPLFDHDGLRLHYSERGDSDGTPVVLVHGLLWSSRMLRRIGELLPDRRVLLLDVRGHGPSERPRDPARYTWSALAGDVVGLLDHLEVERSVVGGLSLGANVALATGMAHPERTAALVVEMPVLDRAERVARPAFGALATSFEIGAPVLAPFGGVAGRVPLPAGVPELAAMRDVLAVDPAAGAALLRGLLADSLLFQDLDPTVLTMPTLVIGHRGDPLHVLDDARQLTAMLPDARLDVRWSIADHRVRPDLLAGLLEQFLASLGDDGAPPATAPEP